MNVKLMRQALKNIDLQLAVDRAWAIYYKNNLDLFVCHDDQVDAMAYAVAHLPKESKAIRAEKWYIGFDYGRPLFDIKAVG